MYLLKRKNKILSEFKDYRDAVNALYDLSDNGWETHYIEYGPEEVAEYEAKQ
jgi:hypothetical protein